MMARYEVAVLGDGQAALAAAGLALSSELSVVWIRQSRARVLSPLPTLNRLGAAQALQELLFRFGIQSDFGEPSCFLREYKNKTFQRPSWIRQAQLTEREEILEELLSQEERTFVGVEQFRMEEPLLTLETALREKVLSHPKLHFLEEGLVIQAQPLGRGTELVLGDGSRITADRVVLADRFSDLLKIEGLSKSLLALPVSQRGRSAVGCLQAQFTHEPPVGEGELRDAFMGHAHREAGEEEARTIWGYFFDQGRQSLWSMVLSPEESEDNSMVSRRLKRMKATLEKMFTQAGLFDFSKSVVNEKVRFEESMIFSAGKAPEEPLAFGVEGHITLLTDGFGVDTVFEHAEKWIQTTCLALGRPWARSYHASLALPESSPSTLALAVEMEEAPSENSNA